MKRADNKLIITYTRSPAWDSSPHSSSKRRGVTSRQGSATRTGISTRSTISACRSTTRGRPNGNVSNTRSTESKDPGPDTFLLVWAGCCPCCWSLRFSFYYRLPGGARPPLGDAENSDRRTESVALLLARVLGRGGIPHRGDCPLLCGSPYCTTGCLHPEIHCCIKKD